MLHMARHGPRGLPVAGSDQDLDVEGGVLVELLELARTG